MAESDTTAESESELVKQYRTKFDCSDTGDRQRLTRYSSSLADPIRSIEDLTILGNTGTLNGQSAATILSNINLNFANRHWGTPHAEELARLCAAGAIINLTERATRRECERARVSTGTELDRKEYEYYQALASYIWIAPAGVRSSLQDSSYPNQKTYDQPQYIYHAPTLTSGSGNLHSSTQRCSDERHHDHRVMMQMQSYGSDTNHGYSSSHNHNDDSCTAPPQSYYAQTFSTPLPQGTSGYPQSQLSNHGVIVTPQTPGPAYQIYYTDYNCCSSLALTGVTQAGSGGYAQTCTHVSSGETLPSIHHVLNYDVDARQVTRQADSCLRFTSDPAEYAYCPGLDNSRLTHIVRS